MGIWNISEMNTLVDQSRVTIAIELCSAAVAIRSTNMSLLNLNSGDIKHVEHFNTLIENA